jgi:hypothetical protein
VTIFLYNSRAHGLRVSASSRNGLPLLSVQCEYPPSPD